MYMSQGGQAVPSVIKPIRMRINRTQMCEPILMMEERFRQIFLHRKN